jgi:hypothetical protein
VITKLSVGQGKLDGCIILTQRSDHKLEPWLARTKKVGNTCQLPKEAETRRYVTWARRGSSRKEGPGESRTTKKNWVGVKGTRPRTEAWRGKKESGEDSGNVCRHITTALNYCSAVAFSIIFCPTLRHPSAWATWHSTRSASLDYPSKSSATLSRSDTVGVDLAASHRAFVKGHVISLNFIWKWNSKATPTWTSHHTDTLRIALIFIPSFYAFILLIHWVLTSTAHLKDSYRQLRLTGIEATFRSIRNTAFP